MVSVSDCAPVPVLVAENSTEEDGLVMVTTVETVALPFRVTVAWVSRPFPTETLLVVIPVPLTVAVKLLSSAGMLKPDGTLTLNVTVAALVADVPAATKDVVSELAPAVNVTGDAVMAPMEVFELVTFTAGVEPLLATGWTATKSREELSIAADTVKVVVVP